MTKKLLARSQLQGFCARYSIKGSHGALTTAGARKLILDCFNVKNASEWKEKARGYNGKPRHPFWKQSSKIQDQIIAMLETSWLGRQVLDELEDAIRVEAIKLIAKGKL